MSKIVCVFPSDNTTEFLEPIEDTLKKQGAVIVRGDTSQESHRNEIIDRLKGLTEQDIFVFMGHGASDRLYGTPHGEDPQSLFGREALSLPQCSGSLFISCKSSEFVSKKGVNAIGFGEIPATWREMLKLRNEDQSCYSGVDENTILEYQNSFVKALCKALELWEPSSQTLRQLYQHIRLCITGQIVRHLLDKETLSLTQRQGLVEMLYDLKSDLSLRV